MESFTKAGALPYRRSNSGEVQVLIVTAMSTDRWIPPMGTIKAAETPADAAVRETKEEAGIRVTLGPRLAELDWQDPAGRQQKAVFFLAEYERDVEWRERGKRSRRWISLHAARGVLPPDFRELVDAAEKDL